MSFCYYWSYKTEVAIFRGFCCGDSGECLTFIDDLSLLRRNVPWRRRRCAVMKSLDSKGWVMHLKKDLLPPPCPAPQGSHCWSCRRKKMNAACGPKCDQCVINYAFLCFLSSTNHLCLCQCCSWLLVRQALGGPACPGPHWSQGEGFWALSAHRKELRGHWVMGM